MSENNHLHHAPVKPEIYLQDYPINYQICKVELSIDLILIVRPPNVFVLYDSWFHL